MDAVRAAREALGQEHLATPRQRGQQEALRVLLATRRCATLARVAAIGQLKVLIVGAPEELRAELRSRNTALLSQQPADARSAISPSVRSNSVLQYPGPRVIRRTP